MVAGSSVGGYWEELQRIERDIAGLSAGDPFAVPISPEHLTWYIYRLYQRASLAGDLAQLGSVERAIDRALPLVMNAGDLWLLKANIAFKLHRLADVAAALSSIPTDCHCAELRLLRADLDLQHGRYHDAETEYIAVTETECTWGALARYAHFRGKMGDLAMADRLYRQAEDELTAKEMRSYAWLEVQRGFLAFSKGASTDARSHYDRAEAAYPGYWLVDEYQAELLGAEGKFAAAIDRFQALAAGNDRPDLLQAIAELYEMAEQPEMARDWRKKALTGYLQSAQRGEVHYFHHLTDYYADVARDGSAAVTWAKADLRLRENFATQSALAWAFYRNGEFAEAGGWIDLALASGAVDAHLFSHAAKIYAAAGDEDTGRHFLERAWALNPYVERFHLHH